MDTFGKWGLRIAITIIFVYAVNTAIGAYMDLSPAGQDRFWAMARTVFIFGGIGILCCIAGVTAALVLWSARAPKLSDGRRREVHNATED